MLPDETHGLEAGRYEARRVFHDEIPGLDIAKGIARFGFNEEIYYDVLKSYAKDMQTLLEIIKNVTPDSLDTYGVTVHGIKGSSRGVFADKCGDEAEALERAADSGDYGFILANNQSFCDTTYQLLADIEDALAKCGLGQKPKMDRPEPALLANLLSACKNFDIDKIDDVMKAIESYEYVSDDGLSEWLSEKLVQGKYKAVKERLEELV